MKSNDARASRRAFLQATGSVALVGLQLQAGAATLIGAASAQPANGEREVTAWVRILPGNEVAIVVSQAEMGQGISTTLPAILADELGANWRRTRLLTAPLRAEFRSLKYHWMFTGGSESVQVFHDHMRKMGAAAREMFCQAAAARWGVPAGALTVADSVVRHRASGRSLGFSDLADAAAQLPVPATPRLKADSELRLVGRALPRVDIPEKVNGKAVFGIDFAVPDMWAAAVRTVPEIGARLLDFDAAQARGMPGVKAVIPVQNGVAVVAEKYWQAQRALRTITLRSAPGEETLAADSEFVQRQLAQVLAEGPWAHPVPLEGPTAPASANVLEAEYRNPFAAHATMEPMNCVAHVTADRCDIWAPTQGQELASVVLQAVLGLKPEQVFVTRTPYLGGGFGRRLLPDFVVQAALIAKAAGRAVKVIWDREEDMRRDFYRPATAIKLRASIVAGGAVPHSLVASVVSPAILARVFPAIQETLDKTGVDPTAMEGMQHTPYRFAQRGVDFHLLKTPIPTSVMRSTGYGPNVFALESFIDEVAVQMKLDPMTLRKRLLAHDANSTAILARLEQLSGWGRPLPAGVGRGLAFTEAFDTLIGLVIEASVKDGAVRLRRAWAVVDCGRVLDPGIARAAIEGGIVFGMAYCKTEVTFKAGRVQQDNLARHALPYLAETPEIQVEFLASARKLGGVGEVSPVLVPPAVANAIYSASGQRIRQMPLARSGLHFA